MGGGADRGSGGVCAFLFIDVEGAAMLWEDHPAHVEQALARHDVIVSEAVADHGGRIFTADGDGSCGVVFGRTDDAVEAAVAAQRRMADEPWPGGVRLRSRMGIEAGPAQERDGHWKGATPNWAAGIRAAAHGGQVLVGAQAASMLDGVELVDLGVHGLADLPRAARLFQVAIHGAPTQHPAVRTTAAHRGNLAMPATSLIGRERLLAEVVDHVRSNRLVTLTGVGGVGKTRLSIEVGATLVDEHPDGVWMVELAPVGDAAAVPDAVATALGVTPQADVAIIRTVAEALDGRRLLVVLDNCEHVAEAAADVARELLSRTATVRVLATSRAALDVAGEHRRLVLPLDLEGGASSPAVMLFVERAKALQSRIDFADPETASAVVEICRRLDGLPLALELAAARTVSMSPVDLRDRLDDRFRLLTASQHVPRRQQTLRNVVAWSYDLLGDDERALLRHAAVFQGGFDLASITAVLGSTDELAVLDLIDSLVRKSLVTVGDVHGSARYGLLETIRQYAEDELVAAGEAEHVRDRHAERFAAEAVARWQRWNGPEWLECVDWLRAELANLRVAFRWSRSRGALDVAVDIAAHAAIMGASVQLFETVGWAQELLADATRADVARLPRLYVGAAWGCFTGRPDDAVLAATTAGRLEADGRYDPVEPGLSGLIEALAHVYAGHLERYLEAAERVAALGGNASAWGLSLLLDGLQAAGRVEEALALTEPAMAAARSLGNPYFVAYAYWTAGGAHAKVDPDRALETWRAGLDYVQRHRVEFFVGFIARDAARLRLIDADPDDALAMFEAAIDAFQAAGNVAQLTITLASATALLERIGRVERAATLHAAIVGQPGGAHHVPELVELAGRLAARLGDDAFRAASALGESMDLNETAHFCQGEIRDARAAIQQAAATTARPGGLSKREAEVLVLVAAGLSTRDIAERLYISAKTADRHIQNLYTKIGASNRVAATRWAVEHGLAD